MIMMTSLYSEPIPVTEITSDWRKYHFPRDSRVITCVNLNLDWLWHLNDLGRDLYSLTLLSMSMAIAKSYCDKP